ncbi:arachidonate 5-lipoxygenase [Desmophyllum pertusum]|uniref:Arachidonate 5-lipoxygenase n=1 Tax=Desmophyllum pertusum TaxID=174260 RepID=A0A9X0D468_9CNID|nr:arachidonate 5-lipoxygenase [Desmophyllum pertusum]
MEHIMNSLPTKDQAGATIGVVFDLTRKFDDEPHLGEFPERLFTDKAAEDAISRFQGKLHKISKAIEHRNDKLEFPYTYLLPENTPNSVAI